jgi:small subunit ribosomal protein S20
MGYTVYLQKVLQFNNQRDKLFEVVKKQHVLDEVDLQKQAQPMLTMQVFLRKEVNVMPNIKSAIKRVNVNEKRRLRNASQKSALRTAVKAFDTAVEGSNVDSAKTALINATKKIDKAATKGLIHKNTANRKKSRLAKRLNLAAAKA